jgi:hypothetical protein
MLVYPLPAGSWNVGLEERNYHGIAQGMSVQKRFCLESQLSV